MKHAYGSLVKAAGTIALVLALVACKEAPSKFTGGKAAKKSGAAAMEVPSGSAEERLARVERKLNKIVDALDKALGPAEPDGDTTFSVAVSPMDPIEGPADAKVTIVEGYEFLCPYCAMVNPTMNKIREAYPNDVRIVSKYLLIHGPAAEPSGAGACAAAKQGKYTPMKDALWTSIFTLDPQSGRPTGKNDDKTTAEAVNALATSLGLDMAKFKADMESCKAWFQSSRATLSPLGVNGTPAFFVNGRYMNGAMPFEAFDKIIKEEMAKADKAIAGGIAKADYYAKAVVEAGAKEVKGRFDD